MRIESNPSKANKIQSEIPIEICYHAEISDLK